MVQIGVVTANRSPSSTPPLSIRQDSPSRTYNGIHEPAVKYRANSRMSIEGTSEEDDRSSRESSHDGKTPPSDVSLRVRNSESSSPKSEGFSSSPMSICGEESSSSRGRAVLDLSMPSAFSRKQIADTERTHSYPHSLVPPYSPMSSSASMSSSSGSPSVSPEVKMDEISIHDIAKEVIDRRSQNSSNAGFHAASGSTSTSVQSASPAAPNTFELPKNFYDYYLYQLELASRFSSSMRNSPVGSPLVGKVKPTIKSEARDEETVSYGSLLEQALRNGLKRSPSEMPVGSAEKKSKPSTPVPTPPASQTASPTHQSPSQNPRSSTAAQISVEDVAKTSLRELLHSKQLQEAKAVALSQQQQHQQAMHNGCSVGSHGSRSSSPSVNLKMLLETQSRGDNLKGHNGLRGSSGDMASAFSTANLQKHAALQQQLQHMQNGKHFGQGQPLLYPHILAGAGSPPLQGRNGVEMGSPFMAHSQSAMGLQMGGSFKHKKLLEWSSSDVRDWISTLNYCSEFADIFLQQSVDGVALTLLNETHLMKNFGMKLGPAIKLRCAVWEILGLCQAAVSSAMPQIQMPQYLNQKQIPVGHCVPQHHNGSMPKQ